MRGSSEVSLGAVLEGGVPISSLYFLVKKLSGLSAKSFGQFTNGARTGFAVTIFSFRNSVFRHAALPRQLSYG